MSYLQAQIAQLIQQSKQQEHEEPYYEVLEYIETDGTQYYKTGETLSSTDKVECRAAVLGAATQAGSAYIFGVYGANKNFGVNRASTTGCFCVWGSNSTVFNPALSLDTFYDISLSSDGLYVDGSKVLTPSGTFTGVNEAYISWANGTSQPVAKIKLSCLKIYQSGVLTKDYIPVLDNQMRPCLYDKISKTFLYHTNSEGSTSPSFKRWNKFDVDYIENTGTAYIALSDITPKTTIGMNIEYAYTTLSSSEPAGVIGTYNGDTQRKDTFFVSTSSGYTEKASSPSSASCGVMVFHRGGNVGTSSSTSTSYIEPEKDVWYQATVNWLGDGEIYWTNGTDDLQASVGANAVMTNGLRLFSRCNSSNNTYNNCKSRVRKLQFSDGSTIIRDYQPVVWHNGDTTAVATLYDKVYNKMLTPTGSLKAYIEKSTFSQLRSYTENNTHGYYISATGVVTAQAESDYSGAIPVKQGDIITLTVTTDSTNSNKRIHGYTTTNTNSWVQQIGVIAYSEAGEPTRTIRVTVPSGINYIRISHSIYGETQCDLTITTTYEVGSNCFVSPTTASQQVTNNYFNSGMYGNEGWNVKLISFTSTNVAGQLFGNFISSSVTNNLTINSGTATGTGTISRFDGQAMSQDKIINMGANEKSLLQINKIGAWKDSTQIIAWSNPNSFTTTGTCYICGTNGSATVRPNGCCYLLIEENNVPIAEFIPVRNKTVTSEYGLYDRVSGTLNKGIGTITFNALT